uniref:Uncharacterized protein n=1 Tax=Strombidium rassoulzadegani TaxID=1082188 RepID=A0A7S3CQ10_9SPIT|mmetsp:Transcript_17674/g.29866  ORF Transcript_17674/g.29866 Transcript_17674/m.29866 type:complete len:171 (+) Transcript_17674:146-658(+)
MKLMSKYDNAEARAKWLSSPEFAKQQEDERQAKERARREKEEQAEKDEEQNSQEMVELRKEKQKMQVEEEHRKQEEESAKDEQFMTQIISSSQSKIVDDQGQKAVVTKDKAFLASGKVVEHFKQLKGAEKAHFLESNFKRVWKDHDSEQKNYIELSDAQQFFDDLCEIEE